MKKLFTAFFYLTLVLPLFQPLLASHFHGSFFEYECITGCTTRVHHYYYRDCAGVAYIGPNGLLISGVGANCNSPVPLTAWNFNLPLEVTPVCPAVPTNCSSTSGTINGVEMIHYWRDYDLCNLNCNTVEYVWTTCCRNGAITSGAGNQSTVINGAWDISQGCNKSPVFHKNLYFYLAQGQLNTMAFGGYDPDGDSLAFSLGPCYQQVGQICTYSTGYSPSQPLGTTWDVSIDAGTGDLTFVPQPGNIVVGIICIAIEEWRNGVLIGSYIREIQATVIPTPNNSLPALLPLTNISGGVSGGLDTIYATPGTQLCFDIPTTDPNTGQTLDLYFDPFLTGATFGNTSGSAMNPVSGTNPTGRFCFTPAAAGTYHARFYVKDDACPVYGYFTNSYTIIATGNIPVLSGNAVSVNTSCNEIQFAAAGIGGTPPYSFAWTGGGGINTNPNNTDSLFSHTYLDAGTYPVQLVITDAASATWTWNDSVTVGNYIQGFVTTSSGAALQTQQVLLVRYNPVDSSLSAIDTALTDNAGYYEFCTQDTLVYIKAIPDSAAYPTQMPTYADTALAWQNAQAYTLNGTASSVVIFSTRFGQNPGGPGFIGGLIVNGANKQTDPVEGLELLLMGPGGYPYGRAFTDANGYFNFQDVPHGNYQIWVNKPHIDNSQAPELTLTSLMEVQDSLLFILHGDRLELEVVTAQDNQPEKEIFKVLPNPFQNEFQLRFSQFSSNTISYELFDIRGGLVLSESDLQMETGEQKVRIEIGEVPSGIYFLKVKMGERHMVKKLMKN